MNKETAQKISELMQKIGMELEKTISWVAKDSSRDEIADYKAAVAKILTDMLIEIMNPIYRKYPDITPDEIGSVPDYDNKCKIHSKVGFDPKDKK